MEKTEISLSCQSCGRTFRITQAEYDQTLAKDISRPVFCCNRCAMHGWDPAQVTFSRIRHEQAESKK